jgi:hypothetical protein
LVKLKLKIWVELSLGSCITIASYSSGVVTVVTKQKAYTNTITFLARDSVQINRPRMGWHTAMYLSTVKETVSHMDVYAEKNNSVPHR